MDVDDDRPPDFGLQPSAHLSFQLGNISKLEIAKNEHPETIVCTYETFEQETKAIWSQV
jgi:hypothetical protein